MANANDDNHSNQMNPNNDAFWQSRDYDEWPSGWEDQIEAQDDKTKDSEKSGRK